MLLFFFDDDPHWGVVFEKLFKLLLISVKVLTDNFCNVISVKPLICVHSKAALQYLLERGALDSFFEEFAKICVPVELGVQDIVLRLVWAPTIEWIFLSNHEINAAAKTPNVHFASEMVLLKNQLRS